MLNPDKLDWTKMQGLIPAIVQDAFDGRVLMQAWMNREALEATQSSGRVTFWSRSRESLWTKGETSGNYLELASIHPDCDADCLLVLARPHGPSCHRGTDTCFDGETSIMPNLGFLAQLERVISDRSKNRPEGSYTTELLESGLKRIAQKVGEEGVETALAGAAAESEELLDESADLVYHLLVLLCANGVGLEEVISALASRHAQR